MSVRLSAVSLVSALTLFNAGAFAGQTGIDVIMNQAKIVKLSRAADTVVVGNPEIADAAVQDSNTIVLTGKGFGTTNFVVLDADGNAIVDELISVSRGEINSLRIYRGAEVQVLSCTPNCERPQKSAAEAVSDAQANAVGK